MDSTGYLVLYATFRGYHVLSNSILSYSQTVNFPASERKEHGLWCRIDLGSIPVLPLVLPAVNFHICKMEIVPCTLQIDCTEYMSKCIESFRALPDPQQCIANRFLLPRCLSSCCFPCLKCLSMLRLPFKDYLIYKAFPDAKAPSLKPLQHLVALS